MSRAIPDFLSHLRTDRRGLPVPYINHWGDHDDLSRVRIDHDRHVGALAFFVDDDPDGDPDFTMQNMQRERECMVEGLCQVCHRQIPWSRRFLVVAEMSTETQQVPGLGDVALVTEPWLDQRCAEFALKMCPDLIRRGRDERLHLVPVTSKTQVRLVTSLGYMDGPLEEESRRLKPVMWVKACVPHAAMSAAQVIQ